MTMMCGTIPIESLRELHSFYVLMQREGVESRLLVAADPHGRPSVVIYSTREAGDEAAELMGAPLKMLVSAEAVAQFVTIAQAHRATHAWLNPPLEQLQGRVREEEGANG